MLHRTGSLKTLHTAVAAFPVPTASDGAQLHSLSVGREALPLVADLIFRPNTVGFSVTGPVRLWARVNSVWIKAELIEPTALDLIEGGSTYQIKLSPWWERVAIRSPWTAPATERVTVEMRTYEAVAFP
jgi:hypothetical protein